MSFSACRTLASRILEWAMYFLRERAEETLTRKPKRNPARKMLKNQLPLSDFFKQLQSIKKMGSQDQSFRAIPGLGHSCPPI